MLGGAGESKVGQRLDGLEAGAFEPEAAVERAAGEQAKAGAEEAAFGGDAAEGAEGDERDAAKQKKEGGDAEPTGCLENCFGPGAGEELARGHFAEAAEADGDDDDGDDDSLEDGGGEGAGAKWRVRLVVPTASTHQVRRA